MNVWCWLTDHDVVKRTRPLPGDGQLVTFVCDRCGEVLYGGMTAEEIET